MDKVSEAVEKSEEGKHAKELNEDKPSNQGIQRDTRKYKLGERLTTLVFIIFCISIALSDDLNLKRGFSVGAIGIGFLELWLDRKSDGGLSHLDMLKVFSIGGIASIFLPNDIAMKILGGE